MEKNGPKYVSLSFFNVKQMRKQMNHLTNDDTCFSHDSIDTSTEF